MAVLMSVTPRNGHAEVTLSGECGGGGCGVVGGGEPGPGPSAGASDVGAGFTGETAEVVVLGVVCATGSAAEQPVSSASTPAATRIPPRFPMTAA